MRHLFKLFFFILLCTPIFSQNELSPILFIYDASGSMWGQMDGKTKMSIAQEVLSSSIAQLPSEQSIGLVAYGHRRKGDCQDVEFLVDLNNPDKQKVNSALKGIKPLGKTPLAYSATLVLEQLKKGGQKATIILITDGIESCDGDLCKVVEQAKADGIDFILHIIGFGLKEQETLALKCAAEAGNGKYLDAADAGSLTESIEQATQTTVDDGIKNVSFFATKNGEPIDATVKVKSANNQKDVNGVRTYRDTGFLYLGPGKYDIEVRALGSKVDVLPINLKDIVIGEGERLHRDISFDAGTINIRTTNNDEPWDAVVYIYPEGSKRSVSGGRTYGESKKFELSPGNYRVSLSPMKVKGPDVAFEKLVVIQSKEILDLQHNFPTATLKVGAQKGGQLIDTVVSILDAKSNKSHDGSRTYTSAGFNPSNFLLVPGTYRIQVKGLGEQKGQVKTKTVELKVGDTIEFIAQF